ncbi:1,25-dihydroxyvitamin D(3) 24-hydroxylase, mitochondrial-like [Ptychodera flava]|uniref:1,25-dihydroxyvitamin D(3) 24-hydroxylase, mitochondrial-like n=1 Tax=Ptychodera flava TaxID=63121 RepID=UPI003969DEFB
MMLVNTRSRTLYSRTPLFTGLVKTLREHPTHVRCATSVNSPLQQQVDRVKPFSEMPGEGSDKFSSRVSYALKGWRTRNAEKRPWETYEQWKRKYGPVFKRQCGDTTLVYLTDHEDFANDDTWHRQRTALNKKMIRPKEVSKYSEKVDDVITDLVRRIRNDRLMDNIVPDFQTLLKKWATESIQNVNRIASGLETLGRREEILDDSVTDVVSHMLLHSDLSMDEIYSTLTEVLLAAVDSVSNLFQWIVYYLGQYPAIQARLYEEIRRVVPKGEQASHEHMKDLPYVSAIINETLRLNPVIPNVTRILDKDFVLEGYNIPAGTPFILLFYLSGRNPKSYKEPSKFIPERWLKRNEDKINLLTSLPFGFGPRMCVGKRLAMLELQLLLCRVSQQFRLENSVKVEPKLDFGMTPDRPLNPRFIDRVDD